jgi:protein-S-isoprenylcysteine O-methyltransferase Ste14
LSRTGVRRIVPPIYLVAALAASALLHFCLPLARLIPAPYNYAGALPIVIGLVIAASSAGFFRRAGTPIIPFSPSTALVTEGAYRYTRNPMYLGMVLDLLGAAILFGSASAFIPVPLFAWWIDRMFIRHEEAFLESIFGQPYLDYKKRVRRWL